MKAIRGSCHRLILSASILIVALVLCGCETPEGTALLGGLLGGAAPYAKTAKDAASMAAMGNVASSYAAGQASRSQITVNNTQPSQSSSPPDSRYANAEKMDNGNVYTGLLVLGTDSKYRPHGQGKLRYVDGNEYEGEFSNGNRVGHGKFTARTGWTLEGKWENNRPVSGVHRDADGQIYEGEFDENGKRHGTGKLTNKKGAAWEGTWKNGDIVDGSKTYPDGAKYVGEFGEKGVENGKGERVNKNGVTLSGEWKDGEIVRGVLSKPNGAKLELVKNGNQMDMEGIEVCEDGTKYVGVWKHNGKSAGTITWKDGKEYKGDWKIIEGKPDLPDGEGAMTWPDGRKFVGEFRDGKMHGAGKMTYADGRVEEGFWKNDEFTGGQAQATATTSSKTGSKSDRFGNVAITTDNTDYEVYVDGKFMGNTPAKLKLSEGAHVIEVKCAGHKDYKKEITVSEGAELSLRPVLVKE